MPETSPIVDDAFPSTGRLAAIDYGTVRIGVAICDPDWILASPLEIRQVSNPDSDGQYFVELARSERVSAWVVGLPIHCDGGESDKSKESREFAQWLHDTTGLPTRLFDERFTTVAANAKIRQRKTTRKKTKQRVDAVAAQVLLESFLEACRYRGELAGHRLGETTSEESLDQK